MPNAMMIISPYWSGTWVFDDAAHDLVKEPFVFGMPEMIDHLVQEIPNARDGFNLIFSASEFPGYQEKINWLREETEGNWYKLDDPPLEGWLCPALFEYFDQAPKEIYIKAEKMG